jgi:hypothetical protein
MGMDNQQPVFGRLRRDLNSAVRLSEIKFAMQRFCGRLGLRMTSYFHFPSDQRGRFRVGHIHLSLRLCQEWSAKYLSENLTYVDPLRRLSIHRTHPFRRSETEYLTRLDPDETEYVKVARAANLPEGMCVPVFGPNARNGYRTASFGEDLPRTDDQLIAEIHAACQFAHLRFCDLIQKSLPASTTLFDRKRQILGRVVRGQSNQETASQLALSTNTIDTDVRRCF